MPCPAARIKLWSLPEPNLYLDVCYCLQTGGSVQVQSYRSQIYNRHMLKHSTAPEIKLNPHINGRCFTWKISHLVS